MKRPPKKVKAPVDCEPIAGANKVKTRNKLIGDIQNNDLYGSDDDIGRQIQEEP